MFKTGTFLITAAVAAALSSAAWAGGGAAKRADTGMSVSGDMSGTGATSGRDGSGMVTSEGGIALRTDATKVQGSVPAVSGGVSVNARDQMRGQTPPHNVKMVFALNTGNYVSDVHVKVTGNGGRTVLDDTSNGPWLFATLPPGSYTATATYNGKAVTQRFSVGKSGVRTAQFRWPASVEGAVGATSETAASGGQILGTGPQEPQGQR